MTTARAIPVAIPLLATILCACRASPDGPGGGQPDSGASGLTTITLTALNPEIDVGDTLHFDAEARDGTGALLPGRSFNWRSSNATVGIIVDGDLVGIAPGATLVTAE